MYLQTKHLKIISFFILKKTVSKHQLQFGSKHNQMGFKTFFKLLGEVGTKKKKNNHCDYNKS